MRPNRGRSRRRQLLSAALALAAVALTGQVDDGRGRPPHAAPDPPHPEDIVHAVAFAPDGKTLAAAGGDGAVRLWDVAAGATRAELRGHAGRVVACAFSPDGATLATAGRDAVVRLWEPAAGRLRAELSGHASEVVAVGFTPDGTTLVTAGRDGTARAWDAGTGEARAVFHRGESWVESLAVAPDGKAAALGLHDGTIRVVELEGGRLRATLPGNNGSPIWSLAYSTDGRTLFAGELNQINLWDVDAAKVHRSVATGSGAHVSLAFVPGGGSLTTVARAIGPGSPALASGIFTFETQNWNQVDGRPIPEGAWCVAYSPDGTTLAYGCGDRAVRLAGANRAEMALTLKGQLAEARGPDQPIALSGRPARILRAAVPPGRAIAKAMIHARPLLSAAFAPDGRSVAVADGGPNLTVWDVASKTARAARPSGPQTDVRAAACSPDGAVLAIGCGDASIRLLDPTKMYAEVAALHGHAAAVTALAFSRDGSRLASGGEDSAAKLWDVAGRRDLATLAKHTSAITGLGFNSDGSTLATTSRDWTIKLWDVPSSKVKATLDFHGGPVVALAMSPDGLSAASAAEDEKAAVVWDASTGAVRHAIVNPGGVTRSLAWLHGGSSVATGHIGGWLRAWDAATGAFVTLVPESHAGPVAALAISPDGRTLASGGGQDRELKTWDVAALLTPAAPFRGHTKALRTLEVSPDGASLASGGDDLSVRTWSLPEGRPKGVFEIPNTKVGSLAFVADGKALAVGGTGPGNRPVRIIGLPGGEVRSPDDDSSADPPVTFLAASSDGRFLAGGDGSRSVELWDEASRKHVVTLVSGSGNVGGAAVAPDGTAAALATDDWSVTTFEIPSGKPMHTFEGLTRRVSRVAFSADGRTLAAGGQDRSIRLWDARDGTPRGALRGLRSPLVALAFAPDGRSLAASGEHPDDALIWDLPAPAHGLPRGRVVAKGTEASAEPVAALAFGRDGKALYAARGRSILALDPTPGGADIAPYNPPTPPRDAAVLAGHEASIRSLAFSRDGRTLASRSDDRTVRLWDVATRAPRATLGDASHRVACMAFAPDGRTIATGGGTRWGRHTGPPGDVILWDAATGNRVDRLAGPAADAISVEFSPDGAFLGVACSGGAVRVWDVASRAVRAELKHPGGSADLLIFPPAGPNLATAGAAGMVAVWGQDRGKDPATATIEGGLGFLRFSPDGATLAAASAHVVAADLIDARFSEPGSIVLLDAATGTVVRRLRGDRGRTTRLAFRPDGLSLAAATDGHSVEVWDLATGTRRWTADSLPTGPNPIAYSPDGRVLAVGAADGTLRLLDSGSGRVLAVHADGPDALDWIEFSPDGTTLATAGRAGTITLRDGKSAAP